MFARLVRILSGKRAPWAGMVNRDTIVYWEGTRSTTISGEMLSDGVSIYVSSIVSWDDSSGELMDELERQRVLQNVVRSFEAQGAKVVLN
jgi:predicted P-loop ATPase/GTPase